MGWSASRMSMSSREWHPVLSGAFKRCITRKQTSASLSARRHDIHNLSARANLKVAGSASHRRLWRHFLHRFCENVQAELRREYAGYSKEIDACASRTLEEALGAVGADQGTMPNFSAGGEAALRGYSIEHFGRVRLLGQLMAQPEPEWLESRVAELFSRGGHHNDGQAKITIPSHIDLVSLGGGPGYDYVSAVALSEYRCGPSVRAKVYEYEKQWKNVVSSVERATDRTALSDCHHSCDFGGCDVTLPLGDIANEDVAKRVADSSEDNKIFICSYCVAENAVALRDQTWAFFRDIFEEAGEGDLFFITDTTHRLWPELAEISKDAGLRFVTPHIKAGKVGWQFAAMKDGHFPGEQYYRTAMNIDLMERFNADNNAHLHRLEKGYKREVRKVRGAKNSGEPKIKL